MMRKLSGSLAVLALCCTAPAMAADSVLNVYNWSDYIAKDTIANFEKENSIKVKYDVYDSDDTLQAKLLTGRAGYDIVVPTSSYAGKQIQAGIFQKLDKSKLPNLKHLDPTLMALIAGADPGNQYLVPWAYGTDGLGYNVTKVRAILGKDVDLANWDILFKPEYAAKLKSCGISMLDQGSEIFPNVLKYMGKSPDSVNPADYQEAFELLKKIRPFIGQFNSSGYINDLAGGDICMAFGWSGDVTIAKHRAKEAGKSYEIGYFIPHQGAGIWFDTMAIPKDAPHPEAALKWINYIETPEVHAAITNEVFYPNANLEAKKFVKPDVANDPAVYPPPEVAKTLFLMKPQPAEILRLENRLWAQFKSGR